MDDATVRQYRVDAGDPFARFVQHQLRWDWPGLLLATFLVYGPLEKLVMPWFGNYLRLSGPTTNWIPDVEALLTGFVEFPVFFAFYLWTGTGVGQVFRDLATSGAIPDTKAYEVFWSRARASFNSRLWPAISALAAVGVMALFQFTLWAPGETPVPWFELLHGGWLARGTSLVLIGLTAYVVLQTVLREGLAICWLTRLWRESGRSIKVQPYHADGAGGLGALGAHALGLSVFLLVLLLFLVMGGILPGLRTGHVTFEFWNPLLTACYLAYLLCVAIACWPLLLAPHRCMVRARYEELDAVGIQLARLLAAQRDALAGGKTELAVIGTQIKEARAMRTQLLEDYPIWPFTRELRVLLGLSSLPTMLLPVVNYGLGKAFAAFAGAFKS